MSWKYTVTLQNGEKIIIDEADDHSYIPSDDCMKTEFTVMRGKQICFTFDWSDVKGWKREKIKC